MTNILRIYRVFRSNPTPFQVKLRTMPFTLVGRKEIMNFLKVLKSNPKTQSGVAILCFGINRIYNKKSKFKCQKDIKCLSSP